MDLTPEQIEHYREFWIEVHGPWTDGAKRDMNALCDMALQTAAAHARITQLEQGLESALQLLTVPEHLQDIDEYTRLRNLIGHSAQAPDKDPDRASEDRGTHLEGLDMNVTSNYPQWLNEAAEAARRRGEHGIANTCEQAALRIEQFERNARWVPVEERLPESGYVAGMSRGINVWAGEVLTAQSFNDQLDIFTHWCQLPEPPRSAVGQDAVSVPEQNEQNAVDERPAEESVPRGAHNSGLDAARDLVRKVLTLDLRQDAPDDLVNDIAEKVWNAMRATAVISG